MKRTLLHRVLFGLLLAAYVAYAGAYIYRTSFRAWGERYFCLFDDGMISMCFAKNLAAGHGLVFNPGGERVEGFTNPLWVGYMALYHRLPIAPSKMSLYIQASGALFLLLNLLAVRRLADRLAGGPGFAGLAAAAFTAFYLPLNTWGLQGMEVSLLALLISVAVERMLAAWERGTFSRGAYWLLGVGTLVRLDAAVPLLAAALLGWGMDRPRRAAHARWGLGLLLLFLGGQTAARWLYYGEWLPNTYYLKMTGYPLLMRLSAGLFHYAHFVLGLNWLLYLLPFAALWRSFGRARLLPVWLFLAQSAYSIYVGGDAWEWGVSANRYVCVVIPLFFVMAAVGLDDAWRGLAAGWRARGLPALPRFAPRAGAAALVAACLVTFNVNFNIANLAGPLSEWLLRTPGFDAIGNQKRVEMAIFLKQVTRPGARVAVVYAGAIPYFMDRYTIDLLGKNEKRIARAPMKRPRGLGQWLLFYPGHMKWDFAYTLGELKPDVVAQLWAASAADAQPYLDRDYVSAVRYFNQMYFRKDSDQVLWDRALTPDALR